ncbi:MAG: type II secretion system protein [Gammaproteobacteria bacterium]
MKRDRCFLQRGMTLVELTVVLLIMLALAGVVAPYVGGIGRAAMCQTTDATMQAVKQAIMGGAAGAGYYADMLGNYPARPGASGDYDLHYLFAFYDKTDADCASDPTAAACNRHARYNIETAVGWRGPYLQNGVTNAAPVDADDDAILTDELPASFGADSGADARVHVPVGVGDQVVLDGWGRPIVLQVPTSCPYSQNALGCARLVSAGPIPGRDIQLNGIDTQISDVGASNRGDDRVLFLQIPDPRPGGNTSCDQT